MGLLIEGVWSEEWYNTKDSNGKFIRPDAQFRGTVSSAEGHPHPVEAPVSPVCIVRLSVGP